MPLISVIIPIYKVEKYLNKCVDSVLNQSFKDIEVLLVDDGSPDKCPEICDEYARKDKRVKVIHKKNGGSSDARNHGINAATGDYLMFLDSDDYWEGENCLNNLIRKLEKGNIDVLIHGNQDYSCLTNKTCIARTGYNNELISTASKREVLEYLFSSGLFPGSAWVTVTKRTFILDNNLYFVKGIKAEDVDWLLNVFLHAESFSSIDDYFYVYLKYRSDSITGTADLKSIKDICYIIQKWEKLLNEDQYKYIKPYANTFLAYHYLTTLILYSRLSDDDKKEAAKLIKRYEFIMKDLKTRKAFVASLIFKLLGLSVGSKILTLYHNSKRF